MSFPVVRPHGWNGFLVCCNHHFVQVLERRHRPIVAIVVVVVVVALPAGDSGHIHFPNTSNTHHCNTVQDDITRRRVSGRGTLACEWRAEVTPTSICCVRTGDVMDVRLQSNRKRVQQTIMMWCVGMSVRMIWAVRVFAWGRTSGRQIGRSGRSQCVCVCACSCSIEMVLIDWTAGGLQLERAQ